MKTFRSVHGHSECLSWSFMDCQFLRFTPSTKRKLNLIERMYISLFLVCYKKFCRCCFIQQHSNMYTIHTILHQCSCAVFLFFNTIHSFPRSISAQCVVLVDLLHLFFLITFMAFFNSGRSTFIFPSIPRCFNLLIFLNMHYLVTGRVLGSIHNYLLFIQNSLKTIVIYKSALTK